MKQLSEVGLIEKKKRGQGKPDIIYVMNFTAVHKEGAKEIVPEEQMKQDSRMDKMQGNKLVLGIGNAGEPYEGIGRGELNIEGMPVYRDAVGGVGTPTSDNERTKISSETTHLLAIMNAYSGSEGLEEDVHYMVNLLKEFADAQDVELLFFE